MSALRTLFRWRWFQWYWCFVCFMVDADPQDLRRRWPYGGRS